MPSSDVYHERQRLALCGVHAVNNLLQKQRYKKADFDSACLQLAPDSSWFNPHRSCLGIGNYDVNVVSLLLEQEGYMVKWHDQRQAITTASLDSTKNSLTGILWNVPSNSLLARLTGGRHWIALLLDSDNKQWMNLDSALTQPKCVGTHDDCVRLLTSLDNKQSHILLVSHARK